MYKSPLKMIIAIAISAPKIINIERLTQEITQESKDNKSFKTHSAILRTTINTKNAKEMPLTE